MNLPCLLIVLLLVLSGCATGARGPELTPPVIPPEVWRQVDDDILVASLTATDQAQKYALGAMDQWMDRVYQRTDTDFIPWFSSYWTRQWLTMKVAWYQLNAEGEQDSSVNRLALYLQEQYQERVLEPVAREIDPDLIMAQTTGFYVQQLGVRLKKIPARYGIPAEQFEQWLQRIPAIKLAPPAAHSASLDQLLHAEPLEQLPAYAALLARIRNAPGGASSWLAADISAVAQQTSAALQSELATRSIASSVSAVVGRVAATVLSLGVAGFSAVSRENERPEMEAQLRKSLNAAFDENWLEWMRNPVSGVLAGVYYISAQVEGSLASRSSLPVSGESLPQPRPGEPALEDGGGGYDAPAGYWRGAQ
ncbi:hypothetical protein [Pseudomonas sp. N040]|uniref:hypothetical protein n=1 Tax=Pseudomonas sp. N040 TaxID=2785325 RepID=UPI0018A25D16|nr:hypothetical protein [Pseudomonas sp. N040]MBF7731716.1 hypothetical protein [Pseudomonas sp. N040]MBW7015360.1 hypothetical protein [Pseudomonas sp. N040]